MERIENASANSKFENSNNCVNTKKKITSSIFNANVLLFVISDLLNTKPHVIAILFTV